MKPRILFVDDEKHVLEGYKLALRKKRKQWELLYASSGQEALSIMESQPVQVLVSDIRMPGMDGGTLLGKVKERWPGTLRIVLSGYYNDVASLKVVKAAHYFLVKPCSPENLQNAIARLLGFDHVLSDMQLRTVVTSLESLPALPNVYTLLLEELNKTEPSLKKIGMIIEKDPGISATLLKVVNSAFFGLFTKVSTPARAIAFLGIETLKGLILTASLLERYSKNDFPGFSLEQLGEHCFRVGELAKIIASTETGDKEFIEKCFLGGFMHDLGKLLLAESIWDKYQPVIENVQRNNLILFEEEKMKLGVTHAELGAYLLGIWGIDDDVVEAVLRHHAPDSTSKEFNLSMCVYAANVMDHELTSFSSQYRFNGFDEPMLEAMGLLERLPVWRDACKEKIHHDGK